MNTANTWWRGYRITWQPLFLVHMGIGSFHLARYREKMTDKPAVLKNVKCTYTCCKFENGINIFSKKKLYKKNKIHHVFQRTGLFLLFYFLKFCFWKLSLSFQSLFLYKFKNKMLAKKSAIKHLISINGGKAEQLYSLKKENTCIYTFSKITPKTV